MTKTTLILFWVIWLLDVLIALFGYREFMSGLFGRYAAPNPKYILLWVIVLGILLIAICGSIYLKTHDRASTALYLAGVPLVLCLPYALYLAAVMVFSAGKGANWR